MDIVSFRTAVYFDCLQKMKFVEKSNLGFFQLYTVTQSKSLSFVISPFDLKQVYPILSKFDPVTEIPAPPSQRIVYCLFVSLGLIRSKPNLIFIKN